MTDALLACRTCGWTNCHPVFSAEDINQRVDNKSFAYFRCERCKCILLHPVPSDLQLYYSQAYPAYATNFSKKELDYIDRMEQGKRRIVDRFARGRRLVEIGPAAGRFLAAANAAGYETRAIEQDAACSEYIRKALGVDVRTSADPAQALLEMGQQFDVLVAWHVIEHLQDLRGLVCAASKMLSRPHGVIVFSTPNPHALSFRIFGKYWVHLDAPRHLNLVPPAALDDLMKSYGLVRLAREYADAVGIHLNEMGWRNSLANVFSRSFGESHVLNVAGKMLSIVMQPFDRMPRQGAAYTVAYGFQATPGCAIPKGRSTIAS